MTDEGFQTFFRDFQRLPFENNRRFLKIAEDLQGRSKDVSIIHKAYSQEIFFWVLMERCFPPAELEYR